MSEQARLVANDMTVVRRPARPSTRGWACSSGRRAPGRPSSPDHLQVNDQVTKDLATATFRHLINFSMRTENDQVTYTRRSPGVASPDRFAAGD
ncbi:hypothetical protein [Jiangella muralis]|uniref:hypothetical protein n=1 Tax=Jiangella muralis TaxID=702383 RepID=UPI001969D58B|nr:hypothetical protein [Jiangella muralis]